MAEGEIGSTRDDPSGVDCTVLVLAGGMGRRMGQAGAFSPKPALLAYDRPLLARLVDQAHRAGFRRVLVSTNPDHYERISEIAWETISGLMPPGKESGAQIRVMRNQAHSLGALHGLAEALKQVDTSRCALCLGDLFFRGNPFEPLLETVSLEGDFLGAAELVDRLELRQGGILRCRGSRIDAVVERPRPDFRNGRRWSGIAVFGMNIEADLQGLLAESAAETPIGELFEFRRKRGVRLRTVYSPDFVNVNSPDHLMLAALYRAIELYGDEPELVGGFERAARQLRVKLLKHIVQAGQPANSQ